MITDCDKVDFIDLGIIDYNRAQTIQRALLEKRIKAEIPDTVLVLEHKPVVTIGRIGRISSIKDLKALKDRGIEAVFSDRGGDATYHGPGQVILYPIIDLKAHKRDVHRYIRFLEDFAISFFEKYGLIAGRIKGKTGAWIGSKKIASIGIGVRRWVTFHGIGLNINVDTEPFRFIKACGSDNTEVTSLKTLLKRELPMDKVKKELRDGFLSSFKGSYVGYSEGILHKEIFSR